MFASYLGDHTVASKLENGGAKFFYSSTINTAKKQLYLKLVNASSDPQPLQIAMPGAQPKAMAKLVRLSAPDTQTTNSIDDPNRLVPVESPVARREQQILHYAAGIFDRGIADRSAIEQEFGRTAPLENRDSQVPLRNLGSSRPLSFPAAPAPFHAGCRADRHASALPFHRAFFF